MKPYFSEAIRIYNGRFINPQMHINRMNHTLQTYFGSTFPFDLKETNIPIEYHEGTVKCRIVYSLNDTKVEYSHYKFREIKKLKLVTSDTIDYSFKHLDRFEFDRLLAEKDDCDDILIVKDGYITDTSFSNVVFKNDSGLFTPSTYLLAGTKRQQLLDKGVIKEKDIKVENMKEYTRLYIINTMVDIEDNLCIPISSLI